jgi:5-formyltetrahydrofolate cyclo-ligase
VDPSEPPADVVAAKQELRARLLAARRELSEAELAAARLAIRNHVCHRLGLASQIGQPWRAVFAYEPIGAEPGSISLLEGMADRGASIYVPRTRPDNDLDWVRWPDSTALGRQAVTTASAVLVPALAIDRNGMRLGRGGGSYDRVIPRIGAGVPIVALLHRGELLAELPTEPWDCAVNAYVTPDGWFDVLPIPR